MHGQIWVAPPQIWPYIIGIWPDIPHFTAEMALSNGNDPPLQKKSFFFEEGVPQEPFSYGKCPFFSKKGLPMDQEPKGVFSRVPTRVFHKMREDMRNFKNLTGV